MKFKEIKKALASALKQIFAIAAISITGVAIIYGSYAIGYTHGANETLETVETQISQYLAQNSANVSSQVEPPTPTPTPRTVFISPPQQTQTQPTNWSGPELWDAVNNRRSQLGVNPLGNQSELCTIASIRLNELLELGKLDGHEGFGTLPDRREDLKWIFDKYNISEFLVYGAESATEAVSLWENTLGHKKLLTGGEYVWGCTYAQNSFGVAIAAF